MSASIKIAQINIEGSKHLERVIPFLKEQKPDVVCLQELKGQDVARFETELDMKCFFSPMHRGAAGVNGNAILSRLPMGNQHAEQYGGNFEKELQEYVHGNRLAGYHSSKFLLAIADIEKDGELFRVGTTHFPVTDHGEASDYQRKDMATMLELLAKEGEFVVTGDFNAPRGGEIFATLAEKYKDNVPLTITTSIDGSLHRAGQLPHMVDGVFSTPGYAVSNVVGHTGLSDHWGFTATISKRQ